MLGEAVEFDLQLASGRLHAQRFGSPSAALVVCLPCLTANMKSFDFLGERLGSDAVQVVALDLRGRGKSDVTPPGSYGWQSHARDAFAVADALGVERFSLIGHSMGGAVAMAAARLDAEAGANGGAERGDIPGRERSDPSGGGPVDRSGGGPVDRSGGGHVDRSGGERLERIVLIDMCGVPE